MEPGRHRDLERVLPGVRTGGEFAARTRNTAGISLESPATDAEAELSEVVSVGRDRGDVVGFIDLYSTARTNGHDHDASLRVADLAPSQRLVYMNTLARSGPDDALALAESVDPTLSSVEIANMNRLAHEGRGSITLHEASDVIVSWRPDSPTRGVARAAYLDCRRSGLDHEPTMAALGDPIMSDHLRRERFVDEVKSGRGLDARSVQQRRRTSCDQPDPSHLNQ